MNPLASVGWVLRSMSTVTAAIVPDVRVTVTGVPSTSPAATASFVTPVGSEPFTTVAVKSTANGAPAGTFARAWSVPNFSTVTVSGSTSSVLGLFPRVSCVSPVRPENSPAGSEVRSLSPSPSFSSDVRPASSPAGRAVKALPFRATSSSDVRPENCPAGSAVRSFSCSVRSFSDDRPENTFAGSVVNVFLERTSVCTLVSPRSQRRPTSASPRCSR